MLKKMSLNDYKDILSYYQCDIQSSIFKIKKYANKYILKNTCRINSKHLMFLHKLIYRSFSKNKLIYNRSKKGRIKLKSNKTRSVSPISYVSFI